MMELEGSWASQLYSNPSKVELETDRAGGIESYHTPPLDQPEGTQSMLEYLPTSHWSHLKRTPTELGQLKATFAGTLGNSRRLKSSPADA